MSDGMIHYTVNIHGTVNGRTSTRDPSLQNIPRVGTYMGKLIRSYFIPGPEYVFVECDYKGSELRVLAHLSQDPFLMKVFREGRDLHDEVSIDIYGKDFTSEQRMRAKAVNFGIPYGRGAGSLALEYDIPWTEAKDLINSWFASKPKAKEYLDNCANAVLRKETLVSQFGRKRRFGLVTRENLPAVQNQEKNFRIAADSSDLTLLSALEVDAIFDQNPLFEDCHIVNLVHDSILCRVPKKRAADVAVVVMTTMREVAERELQCDFPFLADGKIGPTWGDMIDLPPVEELCDMSDADFEHWFSAQRA